MVPEINTVKYVPTGTKITCTTSFGCAHGNYSWGFGEKTNEVPEKFPQELFDSLVKDGLIKIEKSPGGFFGKK